MRTTIRMNDKLLVRAKVNAAKENKSLTAFIEEAVEMKLQRKSSVKTPDFKIVTFKGNGTHSDIDLDDGASLLDVMDN